MATNKALEVEVSKGEKYAALSCTDPALPSLGCCGMCCTQGWAVHGCSMPTLTPPANIRKHAL